MQLTFTICLDDSFFKSLINSPGQDGDDIDGKTLAIVDEQLLSVGSIIIGPEQQPIVEKHAITSSLPSHVSSTQSKHSTCHNSNGKSSKTQFTGQRFPKFSTPQTELPSFNSTQTKTRNLQAKNNANVDKRVSRRREVNSEHTNRITRGLPIHKQPPNYLGLEPISHPIIADSSSDDSSEEETVNLNRNANESKRQFTLRHNNQLTKKSGTPSNENVSPDSDSTPEEKSCRTDPLNKQSTPRASNHAKEVSGKVIDGRITKLNRVVQENQVREIQGQSRNRSCLPDTRNSLRTGLNQKDMPSCVVNTSGLTKPCSESNNYNPKESLCRSLRLTNDSLESEFACSRSVQNCEFVASSPMKTATDLYSAVRSPPRSEVSISNSIQQLLDFSVSSESLDSCSDEDVNQRTCDEKLVQQTHNRLMDLPVQLPTSNSKTIPRFPTQISTPVADNDENADNNVSVHEVSDNSIEEVHVNQVPPAKQKKQRHSYHPVDQINHNVNKSYNVGSAAINGITKTTGHNIAGTKKDDISERAKVGRESSAEVSLQQPRSFLKSNLARSTGHTGRHHYHSAREQSSVRTNSYRYNNTSSTNQQTPTESRGSYASTRSASSRARSYHQSAVAASDAYLRARSPATRRGVMRARVATTRVPYRSHAQMALEKTAIRLGYLNPRSTSTSVNCRRQNSNRNIEATSTEADPNNDDDDDDDDDDDEEEYAVDEKDKLIDWGTNELTQQSADTEFDEVPLELRPEQPVLPTDVEVNDDAADEELFQIVCVNDSEKLLGERNDSSSTEYEIEDRDEDMLNDQSVDNESNHNVDDLPLVKEATLASTPDQQQSIDNKQQQEIVTVPEECKHFLITTSTRLENIDRGCSILRDCSSANVHATNTTQLIHLVQNSKMSMSGQLKSVTLMLDMFEDEPTINEESLFSLVNTVVTTFNPATILIPDPIPSFNEQSLIHTHHLMQVVRQFCEKNPIVANTSIVHRNVYEAFLVNGKACPSLYTIDAARLSKVGARLLQSIVFGMLRGLFPLTSAEHDQIIQKIKKAHDVKRDRAQTRETKSARDDERHDKYDLRGNESENGHRSRNYRPKYRERHSFNENTSSDLDLSGNRTFRSHNQSITERGSFSNRNQGYHESYVMPRSHSSHEMRDESSSSRPYASRRGNRYGFTGDEAQIQSSYRSSDYDTSTRGRRTSHSGEQPITRRYPDRHHDQPSYSDPREQYHRKTNPAFPDYHVSYDRNRRSATPARKSFPVRETERFGPLRDRPSRGPVRDRPDLESGSGRKERLQVVYKPYYAHRDQSVAVEHSYSSSRDSPPASSSHDRRPSSSSSVSETGSDAIAPSAPYSKKSHGSRLQQLVARSRITSRRSLDVHED